MFATRATTAVLALAAAAAVPAGPVTQPVTQQATPVAAARVADVEPPVARPHHSRNPNGGGSVTVTGAAHDHADGTHEHPPAPKPARPEAQAPVRPSTVRPEAAPGAMFRTVEAAMNHLASAYNRRDLAAMKKVTTPEAREQLEGMRPIAPTLRLKSCTWGEDGYYGCTFTHTYPKGKTGLGEAWVSVAPATKPGWYMTVVEGCG
ncbi:MAG TPA: hypothetical protein VNQ77_10775 [Frankiaceae bacterium]|nr:hypothetical protein [Frankiaceae bacterium]